MKNYIALMFSACFYCSVSGQQKLLEDVALEYVLSGKDASFCIRDSSIFINIELDKTLPLQYFSERQWWHIQHVMKTDCYDKNDSLKNAGFSKKKVVLSYKRPGVKFISTRAWEKVKPFKLFVYKRFYYCSNIYVVLLYSDWYTGFFKQILVTFSSSGDLISINVHTYVQ
jgi:hypothetical protein